MTSALLCWSAAIAPEDAPGGDELLSLPDPLLSVEQPTNVIAAANAVGTRAVRRVLSFIDDLSAGVRVAGAREAPAPRIQSANRKARQETAKPAVH
jgi:hypothetical protein